jgi:hypothetical protein
MLRDIIEDAISHQADMELIDDGGDSDCSKAVRRSAAEVVIVADQTGLGSAPHEQLLIENPHLKMFVVTDDGRQAHLLELRQTPVVQVSPQRLVDAIRAAVGSGNGPPNSGPARPISFAGPRET